ncbi:MAG: pirin family protein [Nocardioidaceae bacterium]
MFRVTGPEAGLRPGVDVRRAGDRFHTELGWLDSRHSFSFGPHYDPANTHFGLLLVSNHDVVAPSTGFDTHPHRDMEIVTWVLRGSLVHQDSTGHNGVIFPGLAQRMSAGTGILHSERNDTWPPVEVPTAEAGSPAAAPSEPVHFVQMWVLPDENGLRPGYEQLEIDSNALSGGLVTVASGMPEHRESTAIRIRQRDAALHAARLDPGQSVPLPDAPYVHLYVARGAITLEGAARLGPGDAARISVSEGRRIVAAEPSEVLIWQMRSRVGA